MEEKIIEVENVREEFCNHLIEPEFTPSGNKNTIGFRHTTAQIGELCPICKKMVASSTIKWKEVKKKTISVPIFEKVKDDEQRYAGCDGCNRLNSGDRYKQIKYTEEGEKQEIRTYCETCLSEKFGIEIDDKGELRSDKIQCAECGENAIRVLSEHNNIVTCWDCDNKALQKGDSE